MNIILTEDREICMTKKHWETPKLIVITRSQPAEYVLEGCKTQIATGPDSNVPCQAVSGQAACRGNAQS